MILHAIGKLSICHLCRSPSATPVCDICDQDICNILDNQPHQYQLTNANDCGLIDHRLFCLGEFRPPLSTLVHLLKFQRCYPLAGYLADKMSQYLPTTAIETLMPVPLHQRRLVDRGYNQSALIAKQLAQRGDFRYVDNVLLKCRPTAAQSQLDRQQRQQNVATSFCLASHQQNHQRIALVDDVITTGATLSAISSLLLATNIKQLDWWCCCITPPIEFKPISPR